MTRPTLIGISAEELFAALSGGQKAKTSEPEQSPITDDIEARTLLDWLAEIQRPPRFGVGDMIRQREGLETYNFGRRLCIVSHVFPEPRLDHATPTAELRNDILILLRSGTSLQPQEYAVQSWRFERYVGPVAPR